MSLIKNSLFNVAGLIIPTLAAIPAIGYIARVLGVEQFGVFTLCYAILGYASLFDLGLSRAVVRAVAINYESEEKIRNIVATATCCVLAIGFFASSALYYSSEWLTRALSVSTELTQQTESSVRYLGLGLPALLLGMVWFSYLEGMGSFYKLNILKSISGIAIAIFPALALLYRATLESAVLGLVIGRFFSMLIAYTWGLWKGSKWALLHIDRLALKELFSFGGWIFLSNLISPLMVYFDRFVISNVLGADKVAFYTAPAEAATRMLVLPGAMAKVLFPKLSARHRDAETEAQLGFRILLVLSTALACLTIFLAEDILLLWMGKQYLGSAVLVFQILMIGFLFNSIAQIPYARIQATGRAKATALLHLAEVIPYFILLYFLLLNFSLEGAATAWTLRVFFDYIALEFISRRLR